MDSSNRVELLTGSMSIQLTELSAEEKVEIVFRWLSKLKSYLKYLPIFRPLSERINKEAISGRHKRNRRITEQVCWFDDGISDRLKIVRVSQIEHDVVWPKGRHGRSLGPTFADSRNPDRDVKECTLLLTEDGSFLVEEVEYKLKDGYGHKGRDQLEDVSSYRVRLVHKQELVSLEQKHSFFMEAMWLLMKSLKQTGEQKLRHGQAFIARGEELETVLRTLRMSESI